MEDTEKYLIHATVTAEGVVERSDVVGAIFGQTEGLLGDELDLPELRRTGKIGRIDVSVSSANGESDGDVTIASGLDKVETATLAAALETIDRVGPCRATFAIDEIEDVRAAKRRAVVDRATELLRTGFDDTVMSSAEILAAVREHVRVADITEYEDLPAGPRVAEGDAIIVVEGRSDVLTLLSYGIKNAVAVEGTNVPEAIAPLTEDRTVTAFLDADRGGELILEELLQIGEVDYVARPPAGSSVEDLDHHEVFTALKDKEPVGPDAAATPDETDRADAISTTEHDRQARPASSTDGGSPTAEHADGDVTPVAPADGTEGVTPAGPVEPVATADESTTSDGTETRAATSLYEHVDEVVRTDTDRVRFLDDDRAVIGDYPASDAADALESSERTPAAIVLDGILSQELLDRAADRGVSTIVAAATGQFVKRPTSVRVCEASDVAEASPNDR